MEEISRGELVDWDDHEKCRFLAEIFARRCLGIVELNLSTGNAYVIKSSLGNEMENRWYPWKEILEVYADRQVYQVDRELVRSLTLEKMKAVAKEKNEGFSLEIRCAGDKDRFGWVKLQVETVNNGGNLLFITMRDIDEERMMRKVVELFVFKNYDYLILLDVKHNTYTRLSGISGQVPVPSMAGGDYTRDMLLFNEKYVAPEDLERVTEDMRIETIIRELAQTDCYAFSTGAVKENGEYRRTRVQFTYYDEDEGLVLLSRMDVTQIYLEEKEKKAKLAAAMREAKTDALTGIYNQKAVCELVSSVLANQYHNLAAVLFIDVDNFKMVNDTLGHQMGDQLLRFLADVLRNCSPQSGIVGRIGGDEFLLFLSSMEQLDEVKRQAQDICNIFDTYTEKNLHDLPITCSVGISLYPQDGSDYKTLVRKADQALYTSKRHGKNRYSFYSDK